MLSACRLDALPRLVDVYSLSPLGVLPEHQRQGIGTSADRACARGGRPAGHSAGLSRGLARLLRLGAASARPRSWAFGRRRLRYPPGAFQVARLSAYQDWMTGTFVYAETFWALDCVGLRGQQLAEYGVTA